MSIAEAVLPEPLATLAESMIDDDVRALAIPKGLIADTTENAYGYYMGVLGKLPAVPGLNEASSIRFWGIVLVKAGANERGVVAAIRVLT